MLGCCEVDGRVGQFYIFLVRSFASSQVTLPSFLLFLNPYIPVISLGTLNSRSYTSRPVASLGLFGSLTLPLETCFGYCNWDKGC